MRKITFVTSNKGKVATAQQYFNELNIKLETYSYELIEPQSDDITEIAKSKVIQAYKLVNQPCIALDSGFYIEALNGFPKAFVHFVLDTIGVSGILKLMKDVNVRNCVFKECLAYYDGSNMEYFYYNHEGFLSEKMLGTDNPEKWSDLWYIFIPNCSVDGKTLAQYTLEETHEWQKNTDSSLKQFAKWYNFKDYL
ncbi:MAG: hypothetical protein FWC47_17700 [Oscillospiraceae bacterium]|nr:hypothetical protein [Oscillospiraceae bacterium]